MFPRVTFVEGVNLQVTKELAQYCLCVGCFKNTNWKTPNSNNHTNNI